MRTADPSPADANPHYAKLDRIRSKAPLLLELAIAEIAASRRATRDEQLLRARGVGRDHGVQNQSDFGHGIRLEPIVAHGVTLRESDVEVGYCGDVANPRHLIKRARRSDPLACLLRIGTIDQRQFDAGERLRRALEKAVPSFPIAAQSEVHTAPFWRDNVAAGQVKAVTTVRLSVEAVGMVRWPAVLWTCLGGSLSGYAAFAHCAKASASARLCEGLDRLADHFGLPRPKAAA
jgi:hypothetical protein